MRLGPEPLDPRFVAARRALLDALFALAAHSTAIVVAGAQAVYLRTGDADFAIAPFTVDADLAINPSLLCDEPPLEVAMRAANFELTVRPDGHLAPGIRIDQLWPRIRWNAEGRNGIAARATSGL